MEFLGALPRTGPHYRGSHHRNRLQKDGDVCPERIGRGAMGEDFIVKPGAEIGADHHGTGSEENPEPAGSTVVAPCGPDHRNGGDDPKCCAGDIGKSGEGKTRAAKQRDNWRTRAKK